MEVAPTNQSSNKFITLFYNNPPYFNINYTYTTESMDLHAFMIASIAARFLHNNPIPTHERIDWAECIHGKNKMYFRVVGHSAITPLKLNNYTTHISGILHLFWFKYLSFSGHVVDVFHSEKSYAHEGWIRTTRVCESAPSVGWKRWTGALIQICKDAYM